MCTVKTISEKKKLWTCPRCKRSFERQGQTHSCRAYPLAQHFEHKPLGKIIYTQLKSAVKREIGNFKVESLECCIHFVSTFTFAAVKIFREKIRVDFSLSRKIKNNRISQSSPMSAHRYLYCVVVQHEEDIDDELLEWIHEAHDKKSYKPSKAHVNE
jgi:Domain of unknown function (DUF5655)